MAAPARPSAPRRRTLNQRLEAILRHSEARRGFWGIEVVLLPGGRRLVARDANHLFLPASNMKLFTAAAALEKLGPDFVFRTTVESPATPDAAGRVSELLLIGRGDPHLGSRILPYHIKTERQAPADRAFQDLADQVKARGVREITGDLVADDSYFLHEPYSHDWSLEDVQFGYGAPVTALAFNDNALLLHVRPASRAGDLAAVSLDPIPDYYKLNNRVVTSPAGTGKLLFAERAPGSLDLDVWWQIPWGSLEDGDSIAIQDPPQLIGELFRKALEARGITARGSVVVHHVTRIEAAASDNPFPPAPTRVILAEHVSPPLAEGLKVLAKASQNLHAEMLLRTLGREVKNYGSLTVGLEVLQEFTAQAGITPDEFHSLPVAGVDGTLAERFNGTRAEGRIHAKTGTLEHTNALSGYMDLPSGKRLAFSVMGNSHPLKASEGAQLLDRLVLTIYEWYAGRPRPGQKR